MKTNRKTETSLRGRIDILSVLQQIQRDKLKAELACKGSSLNGGDDDDDR